MGYSLLRFTDVLFDSWLCVYKNPSLKKVLIDQSHEQLQMVSQYLGSTKIELSKAIRFDIQNKTGQKIAYTTMLVLIMAT